jgi:SAM-dependent methyltransferase
MTEARHHGVPKPERSEGMGERHGVPKPERSEGMGERQGVSGPDSAERARDRFDAASVAAKYPAAYGNKHRDRRERRALERALGAIPAGSSVLDLPCGTGRLTGILLERGYRVTGADSSPNMVGRARSLWAAPAPQVPFEVQDALKTSYADGAFDSAVCNRLFHHFLEAATRRAALAELKRITKGALVVSFFNLNSLGAWSRRFRYALRGRTITDRVAILPSTLRADCEAVGLRLERVILARPLLSQNSYAVIGRG